MQSEDNSTFCSEQSQHFSHVLLQSVLLPQKQNQRSKNASKAFCSFWIASSDFLEVTGSSWVTQVLGTVWEIGQCRPLKVHSGRPEKKYILIAHPLAFLQCASGFPQWPPQVYSVLHHIIKIPFLPGFPHSARSQSITVLLLFNPTTWLFYQLCL